MAKQVLIKKIDMPSAGNLHGDIDYICKSFGYFSQRDKQNTAGRIFRLLVKELSENSEGISSDEIADELNLSRGAIVHHLNSFISAGLVIREYNKYRLRSLSLQKSLEEIKEDIDRIFSQIVKIARDVDERLGYRYR